LFHFLKTTDFSAKAVLVCSRDNRTGDVRLSNYHQRQVAVFF